MTEPGERTFEQDPKYALRLLVDIAIRALSPAINDPTTAVQALDQIQDLLLRLGRRRLEIGAVREVLIESATQGRTEHFIPVAIGGEVSGTVKRLAIQIPGTDPSRSQAIARRSTFP